MAKQGEPYSHSGHVLVLTASVCNAYALIKLTKRKKENKKASVNSLTKKTLKVKNDHRSEFSNLSNWKEEA